MNLNQVTDIIEEIYNSDLILFLVKGQLMICKKLILNLILQINWDCQSQDQDVCQKLGEYECEVCILNCGAAVHELKDDFENFYSKLPY